MWIFASSTQSPRTQVRHGLRRPDEDAGLDAQVLDVGEGPRRERVALDVLGSARIPDDDHPLELGMLSFQS